MKDKRFVIKKEPEGLESYMSIDNGEYIDAHVVCRRYNELLAAVRDTSNWFGHYERTNSHRNTVLSQHNYLKFVIERCGE